MVALDWGTSSLRGWLMDAEGHVRGEYAAPHGIMALPEGGFAAAYAQARSGLGADPALPALACGMVGSTSGWRDVPYVACPADPARLVEGLGARDGDVLPIVPGVRLDGPTPDVMRGEETQIMGALSQHPQWGASSIMIMPGTHSKWVRIEGGQIESFRTFMTGELYAVLMKHSILGRPSQGGETSDSVRDDAFRRGVLQAAASESGLAPILFSARSLFVTGVLPGAATGDYLSGMVLGDEIRAGMMAIGGTAPGADTIGRVVIVGEDALSRRYARAFDLLGLPAPRMVGNTAAAGLFAIACQAGLVRAVVSAKGLS
ncbi:2-dehydro-3-deoxygalactonokinase [Ameyamaea chiangmaiensis]|uniref:2-dehydro-3-deoxygalactonokinase n=1 Tax=Ameyamaea chiangmaiensis TaxID=442969 RepID=A0A850PGQ7_9PROT|nr:2-dehydro-3-deoxygalactonokinase [Ameyamaea chiangmaiensis]NVN41062.1 2-dehydro-3-deoxygalactonokinase [Ameyamaea chiangmaiensis]